MNRQADLLEGMVGRHLAIRDRTRQRDRGLRVVIETCRGGLDTGPGSKYLTSSWAAEAVLAAYEKDAVH